MPRFSVVMPAYNRADTILRSIASVQAQPFQDWELLVVDDGSTDATQAVLAGVVEPRLRVIRQENQGVAGARNTALRAARGELIAFLDSDDEWPGHHLALMDAFYRAHPDADLVTCEWWEDFGRQRYRKHFVLEMREWYPATARRIGSASLQGEPPEGEGLLRFFERREPIGPWARAALEGTPWGHPWHLRGHVFDGWRWGWLTALQPTVITRRALDRVGPFDVSYRVACDFGWLAELSRHFEMHFFTLPGCIKHEFGLDGEPLAESHLASGTAAVRFHEDVLRYLEELWWRHAPEDPELSALRGFRQYLVGQAALRQGRRAVARPMLEQAARTYPGRDTSALRWLARLAPGDAAARDLFAAGEWALRIPERAARLARRALGNREV